MSISGFKEVAYVDCEGGGQMYVDGTTAYIGHMDHPLGTGIYDVADPKNVQLLTQIEIPEGMHSHKVRVVDGLMVINHERARGVPETDHLAPGIGIYDVSNPANPKHITNWETVGSGVHRFDFDGRYAYLSASMEGYSDRIVVILDLKNPSRPEEVGRWWAPGQWVAGGETFEPREGFPLPRCHHPMRMGDRLYTSYWHAGFYILDIEDISMPMLVSSVDYHPPFVCPTHTCLPFPFDIEGRRYMLVADEDVARTDPDGPAAFVWMFDITDETRPWPVSTYQVEGIIGKITPERSGCHQPTETITSTEIPIAWFNQGLRLIDFANPHAPKEIAHFCPPPKNGQKLIASNDVDVDDRGLVYVLDRWGGMHIVERV